MIILDANVVSEPIKTTGAPCVREWLDAQSAETLYLTATSLSELLVGVDLLTDGKRKKGLKLALGKLLTELFGSRILAFDQRAAEAYATLVANARLSGKSISMADGQIASIAKVHGFSIATRDTAPFVALGIPVINPWDQSASPPAPQQ